MNALKIFAIIQLIATSATFGQSYHFSHPNPVDKFDVRSDSGRISCLFRFSGKKVQPSVFHKVFVDDNLRPVDSVEFTIPGYGQLVASESGDDYTVHVFYSKSKPKDFLQFVVTWKSGKIRSTFIKTADDFAPFLGKIRKANGIGLDFVFNMGNPEVLLVRARVIGAYAFGGGKIIACNVNDGRFLWAVQGPDLSQVITTETEVIGLSTMVSGTSTTSHTLHFFSKDDGHQLHSELLFAGPGSRDVSVFTTNGRDVLIAGTDYQTRKLKDGHFYMSMYDLSGSRIFDRVDTSARLSANHIHTLGHIFDRQGDLIIVGEGWKKNYTRVVAGAAASILIGVALGAPYYAGGTSGQPDQKITSLYMARISPDDGFVKDFSIFPVGPWNQFSEMITDGEHVLIENRSQVLLYDAEDPKKPPVNFTKLALREGIIIAHLGPVIVRRNPKTIGLELMQQSVQK